jgi:hypothetical protein
METRQKSVTVGRAGTVGGYRDVDEQDRAASIEPAHHHNLGAAQRACAVVPDDKVSHASLYGSAMADVMGKEEK